MNVDDEVRRLARLLEALVKVERVPVRELERRLDMGGGTLNRIFGGKIELKIRHILLVLEALDVKPLTFFEQAWKEPESDADKAGTWLLESVEKLRRRPWAGFQGFQPEPEPQALTKEDVRRVVIEVMREAGFAGPPAVLAKPAASKRGKTPQRQAKSKSR